MSNLTLHKNDEPRPEMDELLNDYFQAELPKPWPAFKAPKATRPRETPSLWSRYRGRLALAACVTLLIAGYWSLSGNTPSQQANGPERVGPSRATKEKSGKATTPNVHDDSVNQQLVPMGPNPRSK